MSEKRKVKVGVLGVGRGREIAKSAKLTGIELVALCDKSKESLEEVNKEYKIAIYTDFEEFLNHDMEAVIIANYIHQHASFAIKALKAGKHVMSECTSCFTPSEGVKLINTVEKTNKIYMLDENYAYTRFNQEMRRVFKEGSLGKFIYGEGEYIHYGSADFINKISPGHNHWRNWLPATYYCTHSLAPIMYITDTIPQKVNGFVMPYADDDPVFQNTVKVNDAASAIILHMDNGAVVKILQTGLRGEGNWSRIHGSRGLIENMRHGDQNMVRLVREQFNEKKRFPEEIMYLPDFPKYHEKAIQASHGGGDFFTSFYFAEAIRTGKQPYMDVYKGVNMSLVGILAYRSALNDSNTIEIPDFRQKSVRKKYAEDDWSPDPEKEMEGKPYPSILGKIEPSEKGKAYANKIWSGKTGYTGDSW